MQFLIVDTSSIVFSLSNNIDPLDAINAMSQQYTILISEGVLKELRKIGAGRGKFSKYARVAISLLNSYPNIKIDQDSAYVDSWISRKAKELSCPVLTNDTKLKKSLKSNKIKVYSISIDGAIR